MVFLLHAPAESRTLEEEEMPTGAAAAETAGEVQEEEGESELSGIKCTTKFYVIILLLQFLVLFSGLALTLFVLQCCT